MSGYDDERVITLLRDAVPPAPAEDGGRFLAVRRRARRTQARMMQATAAAAVTVIAVGGGVVAARQPGDGLEYARDGKEAVTLAADRLDRLRTLSFQVEMKLEGETGMRVSGALDAPRQAERHTIEMGSLGTDQMVRGLERIVLPPYRYERGGDQVWRREPYDDGDYVLKGGPSGIADLLRELAGPIEAVDSESVRGRTTTRYRALLPPEAAANISSGLAAPGQAVRVDIWIDDSGELRQIAFSAESVMYDELPGAKPPTMEFLLQLWDFDRPVDIEPPAKWTDEDGGASCEPDPSTEGLDRCTTGELIIPVPSPS